MSEIYISIDVETNGPIPGKYSMYSLGAAAYQEDGKLLSVFEANLKTLPDAIEDPDTMEWWAKPEQKSAWQAHRQNVIEPKEAMGSFLKWVDNVTPKDYLPVCVAYPAGFDFMFVYWYLIYFTGKSPFSFSCFDIKSLAAAALKSEFRKTSKKNMPKRWFPEKLPHTHVASDDAVEQGKLFCNIWKELKNA